MLGEQCLQVVLSTDEQDFTDFCYASEWVRALSSASGKSGKSVDNNKNVLSLEEQILQFFFIY